MEVVTLPLSFLAQQVNNVFAGRQPWQVATITATSVWTTIYFWNLICQDECMKLMIQLDLNAIITK